MRSEDLAPLLAAGQTRQQVDVRRGVVLTWGVSDPDLPVNTVQIGGPRGPVLQNLPALNSPSLAAGDPVLLLAWGATWIVLGRITPA